jgi:ABC-type transport system involved in multi-copper enzyme maturation permease subunit
MKNSIAVAFVVLLEMVRRKDFYVLFALTALITALMGSVTFFDDPKIVRYLKEICLTLIWASSLFIGIGAAARQFPAERESRTIFPLMAKPITRGEVLTGKFLGCWLATVTGLFLFYLFFALVVASKEDGLSWVNYFQAWSLHCAMMAVVVAFTLLGSLVLSSVAANLTMMTVGTLGILFVGRHLNKVALQAGEPVGTIIYGLYYLIPHLELFDVRDLIVHQWPAIPASIWAIAIGYALVYSTFVLLGTWLLLRRKALQ